MSYAIKQGECIGCDECRPECLQGAIKPDPNGGYWIDPTLCNGCEDVDTPRCLENCPIGALVPLQPKKGRCKSTLLPAAILEIFLNGKTTPFASSMVVWEACNILAQRQAVAWESDATGKLFYQRSVDSGRGKICFRLAQDPEARSPEPMPYKLGLETIAHFDLRATCLHLIFSAYITRSDRPWEESFVINDQQLEQYLGLDKRKDLTKLDKLRLLKTLVYQACQLLVTINWPRQGKVPYFSIEEHLVWQLLETQYYFETDNQGYNHLIGLSFTIQPGQWTKFFFNKQDYHRYRAFYQYSILPQSLLKMVMGNWQQHEGGIRIVLWLLFKLRLNGNQRIKVQTLLKIAYGEKRVFDATTIRGAHKSLLKTFEGDLEALYYYGLKPIFDPETYPADIQPFWVRVAQIPADAEDALEFWIDDAHQDSSLTQAAPRDKWQRLLNARLLGFELSEEWQHNRHTTSRQRRRTKTTPPQASPSVPSITHAMIKAARQNLQLSQRTLANLLGKSQSWIRDIENGRFEPGLEDLTQLKQILNIP